MLFNTSLLPHKRQIQQQILRLELQDTLLVHRQAEVGGFALHLGLCVLRTQEI